ncbi:MAG TPA: acyltransferase [Hanamia sp.]|nr:acyltransferase [Hanamia sp.]
MHPKERFKNNYDFLRIFAACCIIFYHSFALLAKENEEPLNQITNRRVDFSLIGLSIFFCISGYLIAKSAVRSPTVLNYLWKRFLRIQPLLIITCFFTIFLIGPIFTERSLLGYLSDGNTYAYFRNIMPLFGVQFYLPGVFTHLHDKGVNGSLWTLIVEERLYLLMTIVFLYKKDKSNYLASLIGLINVLYIVNRYFFSGEMIPYLSGRAFFYALLFLNSAALYLLKIKFKKNQLIYILIGSVCFIIGILLPHTDVLYFIAFPLLVNAIANMEGMLNYAGKYGDFTYGTYVFSFPVQQILVSKGIINPYNLFFITIAIVLPLAVLSWKFIESPFLRLKKKVK